MIWLSTAIAALKSSRNAQVVALVVALALFTIGIKLWLDGEHKEARQEGATFERTEGYGRVILSVEKANEARSEVADPASRARYDECVQSARNPEACKRFLPQ